MIIWNTSTLERIKTIVLETPDTGDIYAMALCAERNLLFLGCQNMSIIVGFIVDVVDL